MYAQVCEMAQSTYTGAHISDAGVMCNIILFNYIMFAVIHVKFCQLLITWFLAPGLVQLLQGHSLLQCT